MKKCPAMAMIPGFEREDSIGGKREMILPGGRENNPFRPIDKPGRKE